eukprot:358416_1
MESVVSTDNDDSLNKRRIQKLIDGYCRVDDDSIDVHQEIVDMCYLYFTCIFSQHLFHCDLFEACSKGDLKVVRRVLTVDSNANVIAHGMDVMRLLRCYYADEPMSPCYLGCYAGCNVVAKVLLETLKQGINEQTYGTNTLQMAAQAGYNKIVQILYEAISERQPKVVKCLMDHNTQGDLCFFKGNKRYSPLIEACKRGFDEIVELLVQSSNVNASNKRGHTPLYIACLNSDKACVDLILSNDLVLINKAPHHGRSPLFVASMKGDDEIVEMLINHSHRMWAQGINHGLLDVNHMTRKGYTPLFAAAERGHSKTVTLLSRNAANVNACLKDGRTPLIVSSRKGHVDVVRALLSHPSIDIDCSDSRGLTALLAACKDNHFEVVELLLNPQDQILKWATDDEKTRKGANPNLAPKGVWTPLMISSQQGFVEVVRVLLSHPSIDIDYQGSKGQTALWTACVGNQLEVVEVLLNPRNQLFETDDEKKQTESRKGANPNLTMHAPCEGVSALHFAAAEGNAEIVKTIYEHLLTVKTMTSEDIVNFVNAGVGGTGSMRTALHLGCKEGHEDVVKYLINVVKVDICKNDDDNMTALQIAVRHHHETIVSFLLDLYGNY